MIPITIKDLEEAQCLAQEVVTEAGEDFVYKHPGGFCRYFREDGTPDCLLGRILAKKGMTAADINETNSSLIVSSLRLEGILVCDLDALAFLTGLQLEQDRGKPWGKVLREAMRIRRSHEPDDG